MVTCHGPTTGRIGNIDISGIPCLLSKSDNPKRKTPYTVEAVSLDLPESKEKSWIGPECCQSICGKSSGERFMWGYS